MTPSQATSFSACWMAGLRAARQNLRRKTCRSANPRDAVQFSEGLRCFGRNHHHFVLVCAASGWPPSIGVRVCGDANQLAIDEDIQTIYDKRSI
jgi:hypothetical protein